MNVHIVCIDDGHIVPRMARWLVDAHGWSMSERPDDSADANLYMPYTAIAQGIADTKTAAWFTHYEEGNGGKMALWRRAATKLDLRLTAADIYMGQLSGSGPALKITPGVDRDHFTIDGIGDGATLTKIGLSGLGSPRKGTELAQRLYDDGYEVAAAGNGWGIDETMVPYDEMAQFYRTLGVFLCTSLIEGIPAPPLEALSCGIKIVVPTGAGMLDELPETDGVRHYVAGNYEDMVRAIEQALEDEAHPDTLRAITGPYSIDAWCDSYDQALAQLLEGA